MGEMILFSTSQCFIYLCVSACVRWHRARFPHNLQVLSNLLFLRRSRTSFRHSTLPKQKQPFNFFVWDRTALLKDSATPPPREVFIHVTVDFPFFVFIFVYFSCVLLPLSSFTQFPSRDAKTSWRDVQIMIINVGFQFFYNSGRLVCWVVDILTPLPTHPQHSISFLSTIACMCVFLLEGGLSFGGCGVEDKSQWKWCWMN